MRQINDAIIKDGNLVLSNLPFSDGQHVRVVVAELNEQEAKTPSIQEIRQILNGCVEKFDESFETMIPQEFWGEARLIVIDTHVWIWRQMQGWKRNETNRLH